MIRSDDQAAPARSALDEWRNALQSPTLLFAAIGVVSAVITFAAVRVWFVPVRATALVPATLTVETRPAGAEVQIDNQPRGVTPMTFSVDAGAHTLRVRAGDVERVVRVTLPSGVQVGQYFDLTSTIAAPPAKGRVSIVTDPPGARVIIDGRPRGVSPLVVDDLAPEPHTVAVASDAGSAQRTITVSNGVTQDVVFALTRPSAPLAGWVVVASPFPVDVMERDEVVGTSGAAKIMLTAGRHDVVLRSEAVGYEQPRTIEVVPGRVASVQVVPPNGVLNINARPWADVSIDGRAVGQTPLGNVEIAVGPHTITFHHPEFGERTEQVVVRATGVSRVAVDLTK